MKILLVEDDQATASFVQKGLRQAGFSTDHATDGNSGFELAMTEPYDAAIVDIMLPGMDGLTLIDSLRKNNIMLPVLVLSAKSSVDDRVRGLQAGGDSYLVKPFAFTELLALTQALLRRSNSVSDPTSLTVEDLSIDLHTRRVKRNNKPIQLQPREFALLEYLMRNHGRVVSKTMIMENVWEYNFDPQTNVVEARVCKLRDKIDRHFEPPLIHTIRGVGYVLENRT